MLKIKVTLLRAVAILSFLWPVCSFSQGQLNFSQRIALDKDWYVQRADKVNHDGKDLSIGMIDSENWLRTKVPSTIMGVLTLNGQYKDLFAGENFKTIDKKQFDSSWWYYKSFEIPAFKKGRHISLNFEGINYYANIWLNGRLIASSDSIKGAFRQHEFDITDLVHKKTNSLAVEVFRAQAGDYNLGFVDWNPRPPDENMGIWRGVSLKISGNICLNNTYVQSEVNFPGLDEASLTIKTQLRNYSLETVNGFLRGKIENKEFNFPVTLKPGKIIDLKLTADQVPELRLVNPRLWWCNNLGSPELYELDLSFVTDTYISDSEKITFGIRDVEMYTNAEGYKGFKLNGKEILIKGAGWTDDIFLRDSLESLDIQLQYVKHMNLNAVRLESVWGNSQDLYDLCDKYGILVMVGWSCQWEWEEYLGKPCDDFGGIRTDEEMNFIVQSLHDQVMWLRNHPSVLVWMVGSDKCPRPELEIKYARLFKEFDKLPYLSSAGTRVCEISGPSGVKMNGPYEYVTPNYWYIDSINGGAFGFNTETGPGPQVPIAESLKKMIPPDKLWPPDETWNYHCTHSIQAFNKMDVFNTALDWRFGKSSGLDEYLMKSDVQSYEALKAMFEAFRARIPETTGIIQWMLNSAWPSLYWQLYDYYLRPTAAYYAARKANSPVQLIYDYADNGIYAVNETRKDEPGLYAKIKMLDVNSIPLESKELHFDVKSNSSKKIVLLDSIRGNVFLALELFNSNGVKVADNFYWLSEKQDIFAWDKTTWAYTPLKSFADFTPLNKLTVSGVNTKYSIETDRGHEVLNAQVSNSTDKIAFFVSLTLYDENGNTICPVFWDDNYFSLLPGESRELSCKIPEVRGNGSKMQLHVSGWNIETQILEIKE